MGKLDQPKLDKRIQRLAAANDNVVCRRDLRGMGMTDKQIGTLVRRLRWQQLQRGVYLAGAAAPSWRQRARAAALAAGPEAALFGISAALWWALDGVTEGPIHVLVPRKSGPAPRDVIVHRARRPIAIQSRDGVRVTSLDDTLLDYAASVSDRRLVERAVESALLTRRTTERRIWRVIAENARPGVRGLALLRHVMVHRPKGKPARSVLELEVLDLIRSAGLPMPTRNLDVIDGDGSRREIDLCYAEHMGAIEADGGAFHSTATQTKDDERRQRALEAVGFTFVRVTWHDAFHRQDWVINEIRRLLGGVVAA